MQEILFYTLLGSVIGVLTRKDKWWVTGGVVIAVYALVTLGTKVL